MHCLYLFKCKILTLKTDVMFKLPCSSTEACVILSLNIYILFFKLSECNATHYLMRFINSNLICAYMVLLNSLRYEGLMRGFLGRCILESCFKFCLTKTQHLKPNPKGHKNTFHLANNSN